MAQTQGKQNVIVWKHKNIPVNAVNSTFRLNLPFFSPDIDWIVGVRPIKEGEQEKMYACIVTWEDAIDKEGKGLGFKNMSKIFLNMSKMEDYPQESAIFADGEASFANILNDNQTLVIYLQAAPSTDVIVSQNGKEEVLKLSEGGSIIFNGKKESAKFKDTSLLLTEIRIRKIQKEALKAGHIMKIERKDMNQ